MLEVSIRNGSGAPSGKACVVNGQMVTVRQPTNEHALPSPGVVVRSAAAAVGDRGVPRTGWGVPHPHRRLLRAFLHPSAPGEWRLPTLRKPFGRESLFIGVCIATENWNVVRFRFSHGSRSFAKAGLLSLPYVDCFCCCLWWWWCCCCCCFLLSLSLLFCCRFSICDALHLQIEFIKQYLVLAQVYIQR